MTKKKSDFVSWTGSLRNVALILMALAIPGIAIAQSKTNKGANPNGKPFIELNGAIVEVEGEISNLQDQIDALVGRVDTVEGLQAALSNAVSTLQAENATLQAQIDANAADVVSLENQISALNSQILDLQAQIDANGDADGALQAQVNSLEGQVTTLALSIDTLRGDLQASIDNNTALISSIQAQIDQLNVELAEKQNRVNGLCPDGSAIQQILVDGSVVCETASGGGTGTLHVVQTFNIFVTGSGGFASVVATCPSGYFVTGGGHHGHSVDLTDSRPNGNSSWIVAGNSVAHLVSYALCARILP